MRASLYGSGDAANFDGDFVGLVAAKVRIAFYRLRKSRGIWLQLVLYGYVFIISCLVSACLIRVHSHRTFLIERSAH